MTIAQATRDQFQHCPDRLWVNPDCGLKTRSWEQVIPALRNMVQVKGRGRIMVQVSTYIIIDSRLGVIFIVAYSLLY